MNERNEKMQTMGEKRMGYGACASAFGLGIIHFITNLIGFINAPAAEQKIGLFFVGGVLPSLICFVFGSAVLVLVRFWGSRKWFRAALALTWTAFVILSLQNVWHLILGLKRGDFFIYLHPLGPGPWALIGVILFGLTVRSTRRRLKENDA
ncbi:hypothetical protein [Paenibacillus nasutitermitis]|uniref:Uncharacterized protein n=1 Tax=Paenibacillus nasutitermitis TaxID=1652958 RepID=A0A916ZGR2_9BACL|nr:hypothetical protein [Paenibacillus nasutitermitis]GGD97321.1 hypothetical protein GCM10010911_65050 [Paenibacillus nasutitermitis]